MIYLASPYWDPNINVRNKRAEDVTKLAAKLMDKGHVIYAPITHGHTINQHMTAPAGDHTFWLRQCLPFVLSCSEVFIAKLEGWKESKGVRWEAETAWAFYKKVFTVDPVTLEVKVLEKPEWDV